MAQADRRIVVAVDFGTTYSGVAWAQVSNPDTQYIINQWPCSTSGVFDGMTSEKVPSELAYKYEGTTPIPIWGFQIPESMPRLQFIKLGLEPEKKPDLKTDMSVQHPDARRMNYPFHSSSESALVDYLRALLSHVSGVLKHKVGATFNSMSFTYVITVPAIWSDRAKTTTLDCAEKAGMGSSSNIQIISEPEAAAIHTLKASNPHGLIVGDTIVVCDAGGGTVDLITFTIVELEPHLRLKEAAPGNGALCGSTYLNRRFEDFLLQRLGSCEGWERDTMEHAMQRFETVVKRQFSGDAIENFAFPVPGIADNKDLGVRRGCLQITGEEINDICLPVLKQVQDLVEHQIRVSRESIKSIFLVGGFGQSPLLRLYLRKAISSYIDILVPVDGWTAVVRGALAKVLAQMSPSVPTILIDSRVARKNYGNTVSVKFDPSIHDEERKYWLDSQGCYYISVMHWIVQKGDNIRESQPIIMPWYKQQLKSYGRYETVEHILYELDTPDGVNPPMYHNPQTMKKHAILHPELDLVLRKQIPVFRGADNQHYYQLSYEVQARYYSAHCEYSLWFKEKDHGTIRVDYV